MRKIEAVCPYCTKTKTIETYGTAANVSLKCTQCSKIWDEDLSETGRLAKSAPTQSPEMATLRERIAELAKVVQAYIDRQATARAAAPQSARFNTGGRSVEKSNEINRELLNKALDNGVRVDVAQPAESSSPRLQTVESVGSGRRVRSGAAFDTNGVEKTAAADAELAKALANGKPVGFTPRGN
jgi:hypothetical protein